MPSTPEAAVVDHIVNPVGNRFPVGDGAVIIHIDGRVLPFGLPFSAVVLEVPNQLLLLTIHGNHRLAGCFEWRPCAVPEVPQIRHVLSGPWLWLVPSLPPSCGCALLANRPLLPLILAIPCGSSCA